MYNISIIIIIIFNIIIINIIIIIITIIDGDQKYIDHCPDVSQEAKKEKPIKMETTINKKYKIQIVEVWTAYGKCDGLQASRPRIFGDCCGAGAKSPKSSRLGKRIAKWSKNENKILWECYIRSTTTFRTDYTKRMHQHGLACK